MEDQLSEFLKYGQDWDRKAASVRGVFILKMPSLRGSPARLAVELNPVDYAGRPTKRRGIILRSKDDLYRYRELINDEKLAPLIDSIKEILKLEAESEDKEAEEKAEDEAEEKGEEEAEEKSEEETEEDEDEGV